MHLTGISTDKRAASGGHSVFASRDWYSKDLDPLTILLDARNARIEVSQGATQRDIRAALLEHENVIELARSIIDFGGIYPSDNIIATIEDDNYVVLEGNRRVCAIQLLLDRSLIPDRYRRRFAGADASSIREELSHVQAQLAPDRASAEILIARLHALPAKKPWLPLAKMRYADRLFRQNLSTADIATNLGETSPSQIMRLVRRYRIYQHALRLAWTDAEMERLKDERVKVTPFVRIFEKNESKELLGDVFDQRGNVVSTVPDALLNRHLKTMVEDFMLPREDWSAPPCNTRTDIRQYLGKNHVELVNAKRTPAPSGKPSPAAADPKIVRLPVPPLPRSPRPPEFFENLWWKATDDDRLIRLCSEIKIIRYKETPIAASMLLRALLEAALEYHLRKAGKFAQY